MDQKLETKTKGIADDRDDDGDENKWHAGRGSDVVSEIVKTLTPVNDYVDGRDPDYEFLLPEDKTEDEEGSFNDWWWHDTYMCTSSDWKYETALYRSRHAAWRQLEKCKGQPLQSGLVQSAVRRAQNGRGYSKGEIPGYSGEMERR